MSDKNIPIGIISAVGLYYYHVKIRLRQGIILKLDDVVTLDMIEPYESDAVLKVAEYLEGMDLLPSKRVEGSYREHAKKIVALVHEAEDAD